MTYDEAEAKINVILNNDDTYKYLIGKLAGMDRLTSPNSYSLEKLIIWYFFEHSIISDVNKVAKAINDTLFLAVCLCKFADRYYGGNAEVRPGWRLVGPKISVALTATGPVFNFSMYNDRSYNTKYVDFEVHNDFDLINEKDFVNREIKFEARYNLTTYSKVCTVLEFNNAVAAVLLGCE